jgi:site-specific recombinase XerD
VVTVNGTTPGRTYVLRRFKALQRRIGLPEWSCHSLRHAFISQLVRAGASIEAVRLLAGHSKLDVTQRYIHATGGDLANAVMLLGPAHRSG